MHFGLIALDDARACAHVLGLGAHAMVSGGGGGGRQYFYDAGAIDALRLLELLNFVSCSGFLVVIVVARINALKTAPRRSRGTCACDANTFARFIETKCFLRSPFCVRVGVR